MIDRNSSNNYRVYNGLEVSSMARLGAGVQVFGGLLTARQVSSLCDSGDITTFAQASDPNYTIACDQSQFDIPLRTQFKIEHHRVAVVPAAILALSCPQIILRMRNQFRVPARFS